jgi:hypothetical protein
MYNIEHGKLCYDSSGSELNWYIVGNRVHIFCDQKTYKCRLILLIVNNEYKKKYKLI